jgi:flagellar biosynthesis/type III secretory pathway protein FliH
MKLSPNSSSNSARNTNIESWVPQELTENGEVNPELVRAIESIFVKEEEKTLQVNGTGRVAKLTVEDINQVRWTPLELERVVITPTSERATPATILPKIEPVPAAPKPDEIVLQTAQEQAQEILADARQEAAEIVRKAQENAEEVRSSAYQAGIEKGEAEIAQLTTAAKSVLEQTSQWHDEMLTQAETIVIDLIREIARALFSDGFVLDDAQLQMTLSRIIANARTLGDLRIYLNPDDAARLDPSWRDFQISISNQRIQVVGSDSILPGGCFIDGQNGMVDGRMETRLKMILDAINDGGNKE